MKQDKANRMLNEALDRDDLDYLKRFGRWCKANGMVGYIDAWCIGNTSRRFLKLVKKRYEEQVLGHKVRILKTDEDFERYL